MSTKPRLHAVTQFTINSLCFIDKNHHATQALPSFANETTLIQLYEWMVLVRSMDSKIVNLQRMGKIGTFPSSCGQEGVSVGVGHALHADDIYCASYRDQGILLQRNIAIREILAYWGGDERGNCFQNNKYDLPTCVTIAAQCLHAAGVAYALKYQKQRRAVLTTVGDGGTSKGDFYEALNVAGAWQLPLVVIINNNQWAISVPRSAQTCAQTLAQKAIAAGIECLQVDGNDVVAVRYATSEALKKARLGRGPSVIEAMTYRLADHTTADDANRYRTANSVKLAWQEEPIARLGYYLAAQGWWSENQDKELRDQCNLKVDAAIAEYYATPKAATTEIFDYLYAELPEAYIDQREQVKHMNQKESHDG